MFNVLSIDAEEEEQLFKEFEKKLNVREKKNKHKTKLESCRIPYQNSRQFFNTSFDASSIKILSYNILCQAYAKYANFPHCEKNVLNFDCRNELLSREILFYQSLQKNYPFHFLCFQELDYYPTFYKNHFSQLLHMDSIYAQRTNGKLDGCGIFFDASQYKLIEKQVLEFNQLEKELSKETIQLPFPLKTFLTDNVALFACFEQMETKQIVFVANVHLYWNPEFSLIKLYQSKLLVKELNQFIDQCTILQDKGKSWPILLCGDFNSKPDEAHINPVYDYMTNEAGFTSCYAKLCGKESGFTNFVPHFQGCIDYIFCKHVSDISNVLPIPTLEEVKKENGGLPNSSFPSDHISLVAHVHL